MFQNVVTDTQIDRLIFYRPCRPNYGPEFVYEFIAFGSAVNIYTDNFLTLPLKYAKLSPDRYLILGICSPAAADIKNNAGGIGKRLYSRIKGDCPVDIRDAAKLAFRIVYILIILGFETFLDSLLILNQP